MTTPEMPKPIEPEGNDFSLEAIIERLDATEDRGLGAWKAFEEDYPESAYRLDALSCDENQSMEQRALTRLKFYKRQARFPVRGLTAFVTAGNSLATLSAFTGGNEIVTGNNSAKVVFGLASLACLKASHSDYKMWRPRRARAQMEQELFDRYFGPDGIIGDFDDKS